MDRHIVYPGSIPLDTDLLHVAKDAYYGDGWLGEAMVGTNTAVVGLAVTPTGPASLQVNVAPGAIFSLQTVDASAYGSLGTDANQFVKLGIAASSSTLTITPPGTVGQSINYLVQVQFSETDGTPLVLPYYNASNPAVAWSGPNNTGTAQNTVRKDSCVIALKAGTPAATGSQTTPAPDAGYTGIYVITCAQGQTTITSGNIALLSTAPFFTPLPQIPAAVQSNQWVFAAAGGTANALTAALTPAPTALVTGFGVTLLISSSNTTAATLNVNGLGAKSITRIGGSALQAGDLVPGLADLQYDGTNFQLMTTASLIVSNVQSLTTVGTANFTVPSGVYRIKARVWAGGGGSGGSYNGGNSAGGAGGGYAEGFYAVTPGQVISYTIGAGGTAGAATTAPTAGGAGGSSSFGAFLSATGGNGGQPSNGSGVVSAGGAGGTGTGGNILNVNGGASSGGLFGVGAGGGNGGAPYGIPGTPAGGFGANGVAGPVPGCGAGGTGTPVTGANFPGGAGGRGQIILEY